MKQDVKYPHISVKLSGYSALPSAIIVRVRNAMEQAKGPSSEIEEFTDLACSRDYKHLLQVVDATVRNS